MAAPRVTVDGAVIEPFLICSPVIRLRAVALVAATVTMSDAETAAARTPFFPMVFLRPSTAGSGPPGCPTCKVGAVHDRSPYPNGRVRRYPPAVPRDRDERLTQAQKEQLEAELDELEGPRRAAAVEAIAIARSFGDLSENFEYHAAKNEQGLLERRITLLRDRLARSVVVDADGASAETVDVGSRVEIEDEQGERIEVEISSVGGVSPDSPVGRALLGAKVGDEVEIEAPRGTWRARVLSVAR